MRSAWQPRQQGAQAFENKDLIRGYVHAFIVGINGVVHTVAGIGKFAQ